MLGYTGIILPLPLLSKRTLANDEINAILNGIAWKSFFFYKLCSSMQSFPESISYIMIFLWALSMYKHLQKDTDTFGLKSYAHRIHSTFITQAGNLSPDQHNQTALYTLKSLKQQEIQIYIDVSTLWWQWCIYTYIFCVSIRTFF